MSKSLKIIVSAGIAIATIAILSYLNVSGLKGSTTRSIFGYVLMFVLIRTVWKTPINNTN